MIDNYRLLTDIPNAAKKKENKEDEKEGKEEEEEENKPTDQTVQVLIFHCIVFCFRE